MPSKPLSFFHILSSLEHSNLLAKSNQDYLLIEIHYSYLRAQRISLSVLPLSFTLPNQRKQITPSVGSQSSFDVNRLALLIRLDVNYWLAKMLFDFH